ncbi:leucyl/phenylalanyl-tRNA--protein transferase, partial [Akkermansia sp.]
YCQGCFPMADPSTGEISFYEPDPRALIPLDERFHIPHGLRRTLRKKPFEIRMDTAFAEVVHACARTDRPEEQWIDGQIEEVYGKLHEMGFAHSVECWDGEGLQGGLYGISLGKAFFGESMFHRKTDASKIALVALVQYLRAHQFLFLDTQWTTPHLLKFGTYEVPAREYREMLKRALEG